MTKRPHQGDGGDAEESASSGADVSDLSNAVPQPTGVRIFADRAVAKGRFCQLHLIQNLPPPSVVGMLFVGLSGEKCGTNASQALLSPFGSSLAMGIHADAVVQRLSARHVERGVEPKINPGAVWGAGDLAPDPVGFDALRASNSNDADASRNRLEALVKHATLWSPVAETLHGPVHLDVSMANTPLEARR